MSPLVFFGTDTSILLGLVSLALAESFMHRLRSSQLGQLLSYSALSSYGLFDPFTAWISKICDSGYGEMPGFHLAPSFERGIVTPTILPIGQNNICKSTWLSSNKKMKLNFSTIIKVPLSFKRFVARNLHQLLLTAIFN